MTDKKWFKCHDNSIGANVLVDYDDMIALRYDDNTNTVYAQVRSGRVYSVRDGWLRKVVIGELKP